MKRIFIYGSTLIISMIGAFSLGRTQVVNVNSTNNHYPMSTVVTRVSEDKITTQDQNGNLWTFYDDGSEDWYEGDICAMIMDNNGTRDYIYDDIIVKTRYSGFIKAGEK